MSNQCRINVELLTVNNEHIKTIPLSTVIGTDRSVNGYETACLVVEVLAQGENDVVAHHFAPVCVGDRVTREIGGIEPLSASPSIGLNFFRGDGFHVPSMQSKAMQIVILLFLSIVMVLNLWKAPAPKEELPTVSRPASNSQAVILNDGGQNVPLGNIGNNASIQIERNIVGSGFQDTLQDGSKGPMMEILSVGSFMMGRQKNTKELSGKHVTIAKSFGIGKFEVTVKEYLACVAAGKCQEPQWRETGSSFHYQTGSNPYYKKLGDVLTGANYPIVGVSWSDAKAYVAWLNESKIGQVGHYRLPSEAEWEYAARAGSTTKWSHGDDEVQLGKFAWDSMNSGARAHQVGTKSANAFGLYDMHGNVWEWVEDCYHSNYVAAPQDGSAWVADCQKEDKRVLRGGSWASGPARLRSDYRNPIVATYRDYVVGFRVAWSSQ
jgi:formylglycine-generating enzyme required for sulfatase activity